MSNVYENFNNNCRNCPQPLNSEEVICNNIKALNNNLCDIKVTLAEAKTALLFLAQVLCNEGNLGDIEKNLILNMDQALKCLNIKVNESKSNVECITSYLR